VKDEVLPICKKKGERSAEVCAEYFCFQYKVMCCPNNWICIEHGVLIFSPRPRRASQASPSQLCVLIIFFVNIYAQRYVTTLTALDAVAVCKLFDEDLLFEIADAVGT